MTDAHRGPTPITWQGVPVPWVSRWTGETTDAQLRQGRHGGRLTYRDERPPDRRFGVLWYRNRTGREGEPEFAELHTARQLACMTRNLCNVCGAPLTDPDGRIPWLFPGAEWDLLTSPANPKIATTPPTCRACWPIARRFCPYLRSTGAVAATVGTHRPVAAYGDLYDLTGSATPRELNVMVPLTSPARYRLLGKQLVVELSDIRAEPSMASGP
jgi:hypothetical protein